MVVHIAAATRAATAASQTAATALGLGLGKTDLDLAQLFFRQQMQQTKRLWTADYAEASIRHGETCAQSARQHAESQAAANAAYYQAERLAGESMRLARDQDSRSYEMAWRAEVRESLRDELGNQNNRFNIIMLCNTVCLGCVFSLAADGTPPTQTSSMMLNAYIFCVGVSIMLFTCSLWGSVIVVRRLHDNTAARLEQKLFIQSEELQHVWKDQLVKNKPTGPQEIYLVNKAYEKWVSENIDNFGMAALNMLSLGVVMMFITAGLLMHNRYLIEYENATIYIPIIFWSIVVITSTVVLYMKFAEDRSEKRKRGAYDISWQDDRAQSTMGPFAKIRKAGDALTSSIATKLGSAEQIDSLNSHEQCERAFCTSAQSLHCQVESLLGESNDREAIRKEILTLLTTATEEHDTLPEEFIPRLNKVMYSIDEADSRNSHYLVGTQKEPMKIPRSLMNNTNRSRQDMIDTTSTSKGQMAVYPVDAQKFPIALGSLRAKLGEIPITTMLRLKNTSSEPLRLKTGLQLKEGKYISSLTTSEPISNTYQLYPPSEIPPKSEIVVACRSRGGWLPTSGIKGELLYTNRHESWAFRIKFHNHLIGNDRKCKVEAYPTRNCDGEEKELFSKNMNRWELIKDELDVKANNEFIVTIKCFKENAQGATYESSLKNLPGTIIEDEEVYEYDKENSPVTDCSIDDSVECVYLREEVILPV